MEATKHTPTDNNHDDGTYDDMDDSMSLNVHPVLGITYFQLIKLIRNAGFIRSSQTGFISVTDLIEILDRLGVEHDIKGQLDEHTS